MRKIKYDGKGKTVCPWGMTSFAGGAKIVGSLGCMNCVNHAGQSYTADGGVVCCLNSGYSRNSSYSANSSYRADKGERAKRATKTDGSDGKTKAKGVTKKVTKKVSKNNNTKTKKEEKK